MTHPNLWGVMRVFLISLDSEQTGPTGPSSLFIVLIPKLFPIICPKRTWEQKYPIKHNPAHILRNGGKLLQSLCPKH